MTDSARYSWCFRNRWRVLSLALFAVLLLSAPAQAEIRALLVGVSKYPDGIGVESLKGPANDVRLMHDALSRRGAKDITILADGVEGGTVPTLSEIRAGLAEMAGRGGPGDLVVLYFSGHGTRQPDLVGDEADGYDEVFLPADVGRPAAGAREIPNGLVDDEIGVAVSAIRATGADVWVIMDHCHSGTAVRAPLASARARYVDPAVFGFSTAAATLRPRPDAAEPAAELPAGAGGLIAFYASQASELAYEIDYAAASSGESTREDEAWYGLFTSKLASRLKVAGDISYRQLFQAVLSDMSEGRVRVPVLQTPYWEGDLANARVLGGSSSSGIKQFPLKGKTVEAGLVHGLRPGDVLAAVSDATDPTDAALGFVRLSSLTALVGTVEPVNEACASGAHTCEIVDGAFLASASYARLVAPALDLTLRLAPPLDLERDGERAARGSGRKSDQLLDALEAVGHLPAEVVGGKVVQDSDAADLLVALSGGRLWFGEEIVVKGEPAGTSWAPQEGVDALAGTMARIVWARRLLRIAGTVEETRLFPLPSPIAIAGRVSTADPALLTPDRDPQSECAAVADQGGYSAARDLLPGDKLKQCDRITFTTSAASGGAYDVNMIYVDANHHLGIKHRRIDGRLQDWPFVTLTACSDCPGDTRSVGTETALFVITSARPQADPLNLESLAAGPAATTRAAGLSASPFGRMIAEAMELSRSGTRSSFRAPPPEDTWVVTFRWRIAPRSAAAGLGAQARE